MASKTPSKSKSSSNSELAKLRAENKKLKQELETNIDDSMPPPVPIIVNVNAIPTILSLVQMIIGCLYGTFIGVIGILAICNVSNISTYIPNFDNYNLSIQSAGVALLLTAILVIAVVTLFYVLFKKIQKDNKKHVALCICAIIFGGLFNLIGSIICLCDENRKN